MLKNDFIWDMKVVGVLKFILTHPIDTITHIPHLIKWLTLKGPEKYIYLEKTWYNKEAKKSKYNQKEKVDFVVGTYEKQNEHEDYDTYILKNVDDSFKEKVALDFEYLNRQSFWFDLKILWMTFLKVLKRDGVSH